MCKPLIICPQCLAEIKSHGEKVAIIDTEYAEETCEWCEEKTDEAIKIRFR